MNQEYAVARRVLRLANIIVKNRNRHLKELNLTAQQADAIQFFAGAERKTCSDLKKHLGVTHQTAAGIIKRLHEKGLVLLCNAETDRRSNWVSLAEEGETMFLRLVSNGTHTGQKLLHGMDQMEQEAFVRLLGRAIENLSVEPR